MTLMGEKDSTKELHKAYHAESVEETAGIYDDWSAAYDAHMKNVGYTHPAVVAALLSRHVKPGDQAILDAGSGTGIMGEILTAMGYTNLTGLDASQGMLAGAAEKGKYRELKHLYLGHALDFADDRFAAVVSAGVFTQGHAPLSGFDELIRVTRPGGLLIFSIARTYLEGPFQERRRDLEEQGLWRFVDASERYNSAPLEDTLISQTFAFRAC
jgi:predicted TPR repeat methyltransferase